MLRRKGWAGKLLVSVWVWCGGWAATIIPQQWKCAFVRDRESSQSEKGVAAPGGEVCAHDVAAPMPYPCTEETKVKQGCEFRAVCDPNKRPDSVLNATGTPWGDGGVVQICLLRSSSHFPLTLVFCRSCGRKKEIIIKFKRWKEQKGNVTFSPFPRAGFLAACAACSRSSCCCIPIHHRILVSALSPFWPLSSGLEIELLHGNIVKVKPNYVQYNFFLFSVFFRNGHCCRTRL